MLDLIAPVLYSPTCSSKDRRTTPVSALLSSTSRGRTRSSAVTLLTPVFSACLVRSSPSWSMRRTTRGWNSAPTSTLRFGSPQDVCAAYFLDNFETGDVEDCVRRLDCLWPETRHAGQDKDSWPLFPRSRPNILRTDPVGREDPRCRVFSAPCPGSAPCTWFASARIGVYSPRMREVVCNEGRVSCTQPRADRMPDDGQDALGHCIIALAHIVH